MWRSTEEGWSSIVACYQTGVSRDSSVDVLAGLPLDAFLIRLGTAAGWARLCGRIVMCPWWLIKQQMVQRRRMLSCSPPDVMSLSLCVSARQHFFVHSIGLEVSLQSLLFFGVDFSSHGRTGSDCVAVRNLLFQCQKCDVTLGEVLAVSRVFFFQEAVEKLGIG